MDHFIYKKGVLHAEDVGIPDIAKHVGTPFYVYSRATLERHIHVFEDALSGMSHLICFAVKANSNLAVLAVLAKLGCGADVVSEGEIRRCLAAGILPDRIIFSGVGKTEGEMRYALENGVRMFNIESVPELHALSRVAVSLDTEAHIALRVNPDVDAQTHAKISTGKAQDKFGIPINDALSIYKQAASLPGLLIRGVDVHIGSQLTSLEPFHAAFKKVADLTHALRAQGHNITRLDLGGGLGIPYVQKDNMTPPPPKAYGDLIREVVGDLGCEIVIEPGRLVSGNAGILVSQVIYVKENQGRHFLIIDSGMNDLLRPAMYDAWHDIIPVVEGRSLKTKPYDVVGPVCETGDTFARQRELPPLKPRDLVALRSAGAYGAVMSSEYNSRLLIPEVLVDQDRFSIVRKRPTYQEMLARDVIPEWV
jgi:diaminopimelate decarboxylase